MLLGVELCLVSRSYQAPDINKTRPEKTVFGGVPLAVLLATEASKSRGISDIATTGIKPSEQQKTMVLIRLHRCPGLSAHLLFAYGTVQLVGKF